MKTAVQGVEKQQDLGGVALFASSKKLQWGFGLGLGAYLMFFYFTAKGSSVEALSAALMLVLVAFLPAYLWCLGKVHGLPILPLLALNFIPTYALPVQTASKVLKDYTSDQQFEGLLCVIGYLLLITLVWWQMTNATTRPGKTCVRFDETRSASWMLFIMAAYLLLLVAGGGLSPGIYSFLRGILGNTTSLALFMISYQIGKKRTTKGVHLLFIVLTASMLVVEAAWLILASALVKLAVVGAGFSFGRGVVPWKGAAAAVGLLWILHAGKSEMRDEYWEEGRMGSTKVGVIEYPQLFLRWFELGLKNAFPGNDKSNEGQTAAERGSLLNVFLKIKSMSPEKVPFLEGLTYEEIPKLLIPRFMNQEKGFSHVGNIWLAYLYEFTSAEGIFRVSIQFDLMMEAYANYGYLGIAGMAVFLGLFLGWVTRQSTGVPIFSLRFFFAILVLNTVLATNNTLGVFVTTLWQGTIALLALAFLFMKKLPNPLFVSSGQTRELKRPDFVEGGKREAGREVEDRRWEKGDRGGMKEEQGTEGRLPSSNSENPSAAKPEAEPVRHERPKRFVYGEGK